MDIEYWWYRVLMLLEIRRVEDGNEYAQWWKKWDKKYEKNIS